MQEVTPDLIASIATRLYNEAQGAAAFPQPDSGLPQFTPHGSDIPGAFANPPSSAYGVPTPAGDHSTVNSGYTNHAAGLPPRAELPSHAGLPNQQHHSSSFPNPGASHVSVPAGIPGHNSLPTHSASPNHDNFPSHSTFPSHGNVPQPGAAANYSPWIPDSSSLSGHSAPTVGTGSTADGLKNFVQKIHTAQYGSQPAAGPQSGRCALFPEQDVIQRLFQGRTPAGGGGGARAMDIPRIRKDFPILHQYIHGKPLVWFDNAATTQKPQSVIDAISHYYSHNNSNIHRGAHSLAARSTDAFEEARQKVQAFLGASSVKEIIFVRGTTEGINLIAHTYGRKFLQPGDEIVLSTLEHHANIVPWQMVAKEKGAIIRVIPVNDRGEIMLEAYQALLCPRTRLVSLAHASNSLGTILPVAEMTQMAKRYGARVLIDGAQSVSHIPVNMQQIGCDFYVFSGHKIFGPTGIGAVFAREELQKIMPPWQGGGNMIRTVTFEETTYSEPPAKFEAGTPNIADAVGLGAALDYVNRLGLTNIAKYEHELLVYGTEQLSRINGLRIIGTAAEKVGVLSFVLHNRKTEEVGKMLDQEGIAVRAGHHCSQPSLRRFGLDASVRPSLAFYNTHEEIDRLVDAVRRNQRS